MKKIIHIVNSKIYSGLEKVAIEIIESLNNEYDFYYACQDGPIVDVLKEKNIKRIRISEISKKEIMRIEKEYKPYIIHAHDYKATLFCGLYLKETNIISHLHNNSPWLKNWFHPYNYMLLKALKNVNIKKIYLVSDSISKEYIFSKYLNDKIEIIGNPVSCEKVQENIKFDCNKKFDVCFCGRLTKQKNPFKFIDIINKLKNNNPKIKALILGDGELKEKCNEKIKKLALENNIEMKGFVDEPYKEMVKSKIFCCTSEWEGYGLVIFEALSLGIPVVTTKVGGIIGIIDRSCGFFCDSVDEFAFEITRILENNKYIEYKNNCFTRALKLDNFELYIKKLQDCYDNIDNI